MTMQIPNNILRTLNKLNENGYQAYIVGGCVRDFLLGKEPSDFDICTNARPETVMEIFEHAIPTGIKHGTITVIDEEPIEITTFRTEGSYVDHRHPVVLIHAGYAIEKLSEQAAKESLESWDELMEMLEEEDKERERMMNEGM